MIVMPPMIPMINGAITVIPSVSVYVGFFWQFYCIKSTGAELSWLVYMFVKSARSIFFLIDFSFSLFRISDIYYIKFIF